MNRSGLITACVALLLATFIAGCQHTAPVDRQMVHETVRISRRMGRINAYAVGTEMKTALEAYSMDHGLPPNSIRELCPRYMPGYSMITAREGGFTAEQTLVTYRRNGLKNGTVEVKDYMRGGGLLSLQQLECRNGEWTGGGGIAYNIAPH